MKVNIGKTKNNPHLTLVTNVIQALDSFDTAPFFAMRKVLQRVKNPWMQAYVKFNLVLFEKKNLADRKEIILDFNPIGLIDFKGMSNR